MFVADILAIGLLWGVWFLVGEVNEAIDSNSEKIIFYGRLFLILIVLVLPILHIIATIEFMKPGIIDRINIKGISINWLLVILVGTLIAFSIGLKAYFINHIEKSGYVYCPAQSEWTSFSKIYVFVRGDSECESIRLE